MAVNYINIAEEKLVPVVAELNRLLADYHIYYQKLRAFHWNIRGEHFFELHQEFEALYADARIKIDAIAERILTLRYHPVSRINKYLEISTIKEVNPLISDIEMVKETIRDHAALLLQMEQVIVKAQNVGDEGTLDMMGAYVAELQKASWMLEAWTLKEDERFSASTVKRESGKEIASQKISETS